MGKWNEPIIELFLCQNKPNRAGKKQNSKRNCCVCVCVFKRKNNKSKAWNELFNGSVPDILPVFVSLHTPLIVNDAKLSMEIKVMSKNLWTQNVLSNLFGTCPE